MKKMTLVMAMVIALAMSTMAGAFASGTPLTGDPEADGWVFSGNSLAQEIYVRGSLNASYDIYTNTFEVDDPSAFDISDHDGEEYDDYYRVVPGTSDSWSQADARAWEAGHTVVAVGGTFTDITSEAAGWDEFNGNEVNAALRTNMRYQAKFGTADATWAASTTAPSPGNGSGSTGDGGDATFLVRTSGFLGLPGDAGQPIGAMHTGEMMGLQETGHISSPASADAARLIWNWNDEKGYIDSWQILLNTTLVAEDLGDGDHLLTGEGDPVVTTVQGSGYTDALVAIAAPEVLTKDACKDGGWQDLGYRNQGQCVSDFARNK